MRQVGMKAYQTVLFPYLAPADLQRLNQLGVVALPDHNLDVDREIDRALAVTQPMIIMKNYDIHLVGDLLAVMLNLSQWNNDIRECESMRLWGSRTVTYFVYDEGSGLFAPSKFCAYTAVPNHPPLPNVFPKDAGLGTMTIAVYTSFNDGSHLLDGHRAQRHLTLGVGMTAVNPAGAPEVAAAFAWWREQHTDCIVVHPSGPIFLLNPEWFT